MNWKATMELKWVEVYDNKDLEGPCTTNGAYYPEAGPSFWQLKQKWVSDQGQIEWRLIPIEY